MTFDEYINNPMGVKNAVISNREMYRKMYTEKLNKILIREIGRMEYKLFTDKEKYYCYMKIPSEKAPGVYYDVIAEFSKPKVEKDAKVTKVLDNTLKNYNVKFFSNDPSFMFSFCHAFVKNKMFITQFADKMSKEALTQRGLEKNPKDLVGYVKTLYFMYLVMQKKGLFTKSLYTEPYNEEVIARNILPAEKKLEERQARAKKISRRKKLRRKGLDFIVNDQDDIESRRVINTSTSTKTVKKTKVIGGINKSKKTNTIKRTKTIK